MIQKEFLSAHLDQPHSIKNPLPGLSPSLQLGTLDHYTLIVPDAAASTRFHMEVLGFGWVREQLVNAGSVPPGQYDMLNHILHLPGDPSRVMVITEGLTEESIFRRYMKQNGSGVHHIAYRVKDLEFAFNSLQKKGIRLTSDRILTDPVSGLQQFFIAKEYAGYFIELIERTDRIEDGEFVEDNMSGLARTMESYLQ